ncbi:MAG: agmatinase [Candidatus Thermoplasmatota archaeon]|nr:agmatinase [Candidatus Thermoplasmatota archaeon]MEE3083473.1 agmatinase [Candidatus Thermoplasmatota archaeon]
MALFGTVKRRFRCPIVVTAFDAENFLGLPPVEGNPDVIVLPIPYELTTSYGQGTENGPSATLKASTQVELYDPLLPEDLPCGFGIKTANPWDGEGNSLQEQLDGIEKYLHSNVSNSFPIILGGEHGMLPAIVSWIGESIDLSELTIVQIDAHADLRNQLDGDPNSHACAARRALDLGVGNLLQVGIRAISREEAQFIHDDLRVKVWPAREILNPCGGEMKWNEWLSTIENLKGPVWLTLDVDGLDTAHVPTTGTPVPGGLAYWQVVETIERLASANIDWVGADINEIVPDPSNHVTEFTAAMLATKCIAAHLATKLEEK